MTKRYVRALRAEDDGDGGVMTFVASTSGEKRDGLDIDQDAWELDNYRANPVVLLNHDYSSLPLGRADVDVEDGQLMARITWDSDDPRAAEVRGKYERGLMHAVSVGWRDTDDGHELLDVSAVAVPGDPQALMERTRQWARDVLDDGNGYNYLSNGQDFIRISDNDAGTEAEEPAAPVDDDSEQPTRESWREIAAGMVEVFDVSEDADDDAREVAYRALRPLYRKWDRVIPEFMPAAEVAALGVEEWRGLFLEDELEVTGFRAGKVLSSRNEGKLKQAADLITEVLRSAAKEEKAKNTSTDDDDDGERGQPAAPFDWATPELRRALGLTEN